MLGIDRRLRTPLLAAAGLALALGLGCRRELPELFDRNKAPETYVTAAPVESLFDGFRIQLNWYGLDPDGEIAYYLWAWTDSSRAYFSAWNPETRADDRILREGLFEATHLTTRTDSIFTIQANDNGGTARDVTFNVTAVDDQGKRDPVPARLYFFGSVDARPQIVWLATPPDTLDSGESFSCRFTATTQNGYILGYKWASGADPSFEPRSRTGEQIWTYQIADDCSNVKPEDGYCGLQDSTAISLIFANDIGGADADMIQFYKFGTFLIKARAIDLAGVESELNTSLSNLRGAVAPVLNRDPDTRLRPWDGAEDYPIEVTYPTGQGQNEVYRLNAVRVDTLPDGRPAPPGFHYAVRETVPWGDNAWIRFFWQGWDYDDPIIAADVEDIVGDEDTIQTRFQMSYSWTKKNLTNGIAFSANSNGRFPAGGELGYPEELEFDAFGEAGSNFRMNILPVTYTVYGYAQDHFERVDGTPVSVTFTGGFASTVDSIIVSAIKGDGSPSAVRVNLTTLPPGDPVRIALHAYPAFWPPTAEVGAWDPATRIFTLNPSVVTGVGPNALDEYNPSFTFYGHDDSRNGEAKQLGRARWDLADPDFPISSLQFVADVYEAANQTTVNYWKEVFPGNADPPASGSFTVQLKIRDIFSVINTGPTPIYLGPKMFKGEFCNTIASQVVTEMIEDTPQRQIGLNNTGRVSLPLRAPVDIQYAPF